MLDKHHRAVLRYENISEEHLRTLPDGVVALHYLSLNDSQKASRYVERLRERGAVSDPLDHAALLLYQGDVQRACTQLSIAAKYSLYAMKRAQTLCFYLGQTERMLQLTEDCNDAIKCGYYWGMRAWALEESSMLAAARDAAERAPDDDVWAHHALAHVLLTQQRFDEGVSLLSAWSAAWTSATFVPFLRTHMYWHLALMYNGRAPQTVQQIFDEHLWREEDRRNDQTLINAITLLIKTRELSGARWESVKQCCCQLEEAEVAKMDPFLVPCLWFVFRSCGEPTPKLPANNVVDVLSSNNPGNLVSMRIPGCSLEQSAVLKEIISINE